MTKFNKITDKMRLELANGRILTSYKDFDLSKYQPNMVPGKPTLPGYPGGIFDSTIFGSPYVDRCDCGFTKGQGVTCPKCHSHINSPIEQLNAVGLIKSPFYFINSVQMESLNKLLNSVFSNSIYLKLDDLYTRFFTYNESSNTLVMSGDVTTLVNPDFTNLSIEGLIKIFEEYKSDRLTELMYIVQRYIIVRPVSMRPWSYTYKSWLGKRTLEKHQLNFQYQSLIYLSTELVNGLSLNEGTVEDQVYSIASIRLAITKIMDGVTELIKTSKASSIRSGFGTRIPNSGRGVALADPNLTINQVSLPIAMCYEIFRNQFMTWISNDYKLTEEEITSKIVNKDKDIVDLFRKFVDESDLYVMINRAPTLYKLSQLVFEVTLNEGSAIGYSLMATTPLNLDFDGDTIAVYEVPQHLKSKVANMLPSNCNRYMKSDEEVILPKQETLIGLMIATRNFDSDSEPKVKVENLSVADSKYDNGDFNSNDCIQIGNEINSYGRIKLSTILGFKIDYEINKSNISSLVTSIKSSDDYVTKMKEMQDFALKISTFESQSDLSLENFKESSLDLEGESMGTDNISIYGKSIELAKRVKPLKDSLKGSKSAISSIVNPQLMYSEGSFMISSDSMLGNMSASEYIRISAEFRKVQQVKVNSVGESGYLARQIWTAMSKLVFSNESVTPKKLLNIIPDTNGNRYANGVKVAVKKGVPVDVDSVIYNLDNTVYPCDLFDSMQFRDGHLIGIDFGMQISEGTTQGILKLKHEGGYVSFSNYGLLEAYCDATVTHDSSYIYINGSKFLKSPKFKFVDPNKTEYKKGDLIGINPTLVSPTTNLYLLMKLVKALGSTTVIAKPKTYISLYSINSGIVKFVDGKVVIGSQVYVMPEESLCLVSEGQKVEVGTKLFTGALDYPKFLSNYSSLGINIIYKIFENEFKSFANIKSLMIEFLFKAIHYIDVLDNGDEVIAFKGIANAIDPSEDLLTSLTMGFIKKKISKFIASDSNDLGDSSIINVAYQFNTLRLSNFSQTLIENK